MGMSNTLETHATIPNTKSNYFLLFSYITGKLGTFDRHQFLNGFSLSPLFVQFLTLSLSNLFTKSKSLNISNPNVITNYFFLLSLWNAETTLFYNPLSSLISELS